jgi:amidophosphoribosyltransferase
MCGIVGLLVKKPALKDQLGALMVPMLLGMTERGPDSAGLAVFGDALDSGHRKLSLYSGLTPEGSHFEWTALVTALKMDSS